MVVHAKIQMLQHQPAPQHGQIPAENRPHPRQKWRLGWHWQQKTILQKLFERWAGPRQFRSKRRQRHSCPSLCSQCHVHTPSPHDDVLIAHSLCRVGLPETHLFLAGSKLTAAPGLTLCQHTQKARGGKVLVSGMRRGNRSRTKRALL